MLHRGFFQGSVGMVGELTLPLPVGGGTPATSCSSMKDSHHFCAVPAATALLPSFKADDKGEAEGLMLLQVNSLPATVVEHTTPVCSFQGHYSLPSAGGAQEDGVSISHTDHEVSSAHAPLNSGTTIFLFSQPGLAGFLKGLHSQAWD